MEVDIDMIDADGSIVKNIKHDEDVMKPASEAGSLNSDISYHDDDDDDDVIDNEDEVDDSFDYDDDDYYMFEDVKEDHDDSHNLNMQAQFDNINIPAGVEVSFSWLDDIPSISSTLADTHVHDEIPILPLKDVSSSSPVLPNIYSKKENATEEAKKKLEQFKKFDVVDDFYDHHFNNAGFQGQHLPRTWTKKIQDEWKILEKDLPDSIFVRAYETRMDLLRAVIVGPAGTPYHDGLFVFHIHFPPTYPNTPPMVYYYSGGLRLNPSLYASGKVCLSFLNTWTGKGSEKWIPNNSTMLQVLVSIQALILNDKPFFNEPGYDNTYTGLTGENRSKQYNEDIFILSLKTMLYTLRRPSKHFEALVVGHFSTRAHAILTACRGYMEGVKVGGLVVDEKGVSKKFKEAVGQLVNGLVSNFSRCSGTDFDQFRV